MWGATAILPRVYIRKQALERLFRFLSSSGLFTCDAYFSFGLFPYLAWFLFILVLLLVAYWAISFRVVFILWTLFMWIKPVNISVVFCQIRNTPPTLTQLKWRFGYSKFQFSDMLCSNCLFKTLNLCVLNLQFLRPCACIQQRLEIFKLIYDFKNVISLRSKPFLSWNIFSKEISVRPHSIVNYLMFIAFRVNDIFKHLFSFSVSV